MAILKYYKYQNNNAKNEKSFQKWYGRVVIDETVGIESIASEMQDNCTVKRADILAVLSELGPTVKRLMQNSKRVTIPYLGSFKFGIKTSGADEKSDFGIANIKSVHVIFQPITTVEANGTRVKELVQGTRLAEYKNISQVVDGEDTNDTGSGNTGGSGSTGGSDEQPE